MKINLASSQRVKVRVEEYEDADVLAAIQAGKVGLLTIAINADRRQKVALVEFRSDLADLIEKFGFKPLTKTATKDGVETQEWTETEGEYIRRFQDALEDGSFTPEGFTQTGTEEKTKEACALAFIQSLADQCGPYVLSIDRAEPKAKAGKLPAWALEKATAAFARGHENVQKWIKTFAAGFTSPEGITIDPINVEAFDIEQGHHTPEERQKIHAGNVAKFAKAIVEYQKQKAAKSQNEFAA